MIQSGWPFPSFPSSSLTELIHVRRYTMLSGRGEVLVSMILKKNRSGTLKTTWGRLAQDQDIRPVGEERKAGTVREDNTGEVGSSSRSYRVGEAKKKKKKAAGRSKATRGRLAQDQGVRPVGEERRADVTC
jgi:hypothetical protein